MSAVVHIAAKDMRVLWRDKMGMFWVLGFPLFMALFFGAIFGGGGNGGGAKMPVAVIDEDRTDGSRAFTQRLRSSEALEVTESDLDSARTAVRKGDIVAFVRVEKGFGDSFALFGGQEMPLEVGIDPARRAEAGYLQGLVMQASFESLQTQISDPAKLRGRVQEQRDALSQSTGGDPHQREVVGNFLGSLDAFLGDVDAETYREGMPLAKPAEGGGLPSAKEVAVVREEDGPRTYYEISFPASITWGMLGCVSAFALSLIRERLSGTMLRLRVAPLSRAQVLAGKGLACFSACVISGALMLVLGHLVFGVRVESLALLALGLACSGACFVGIMMLLSTAGRTIQAVSGIGWGLFVVMEMIGGGTIPLMAMPAWLVKVSHFSPVKWAILALEGAIWRDFTFTEMLLPCGILVAIGAVCFVAGVVVLERQRG